MKNYGWYQMTASDTDSNAVEVTSLSVRVTLLTIFVFGALALLVIPVSNFPGPQMPSCSADNAGGLYCCWAAPISTQL
jgi:hypothetical protein